VRHLFRLGPTESGSRDVSEPQEAPWWSPEVLAAKERLVRSGVDEASSDIRNDYAAYKSLNAGADPIASGLYLHNEFDWKRIRAVCADYRRIVGSVSLQQPGRIADLGSGAGFTTEGLRRTWPGATVVGFELSEDAVEYARRQWPHCRFTPGAIRHDSPLADGPFDLIVCQEFYPFTRTDRLDDHRQWIEFVRANLSPGGVGLITVTSSNTESINSTFAVLRHASNVGRVRLAAPRLARKLPFVLSRIAGSALATVRPSWSRSIYVATAA
jgi:SAM-dependent methyltransferase